jgi:hypothetical protein
MYRGNLGRWLLGRLDIIYTNGRGRLSIDRWLDRTNVHLLKLTSEAGYGCRQCVMILTCDVELLLKLVSPRVKCSVECKP